MKKVQDQIDFFASLPIFKSHTRRNVSTLIPHFEKVNMQRGEVIFSPGEEAKYAYIILNGQVKLQKQIVAEEKFNFEVPDDFYPQKLPKKKIDVRNLYVNKQIVGCLG
jgi:CRP-like cAMP-binding protein